MILNIYNQYYSDKSEGNTLGHKMKAEKRPEIYTVNFPYFKISKVLFWQHKHTNKAHALQYLYLFLKSCHSLYNLSRAPLVLVRIFSSTDSKSSIRDTNRRANFTSHDGWNRFRDWNKQTNKQCKQKYYNPFQLLVIYLILYFIKKARLMALSCMSACLSPSNNFWTYWPILTKFCEHNLAY
jgi:hypothetical protein